MLALLAVSSLSAFSAGIFLRVKWNTMLPAAGAGLLLGFLGLIPGFPLWAGFGLGLLCAAAWMTAGEKRPFEDGLLAACIGGCPWGLWTTLYSGLENTADGAIVLFLYCMFFLLHIPAVLLTFDRFRLPRDWQRKTKGAHNFWVPAVGLGMPLLNWAVLFLPGEGLPGTVAKVLLLTALFWLSLGVMALLVACGQKQDQTAAEHHYHSEMNTFMNVVRSQRHDYNLHVQTLASLIARQKWDECTGYIHTLVQDTNQMNQVLPIRDPAVAGLIHSYRSLAQQQGCVLVPDIRDDLSHVVTNAYETNKIIGNLLQNALDELARQETPGTVTLSIFKRGGYSLVRVSNRVANPAEFQAELIFRQGFTTKQGHDGVGLSSIRALARQYGGDVTARLEGDTVHFVATIPIELTLTQ